MIFLHVIMMLLGISLGFFFAGLKLWYLICSFLLYAATYSICSVSFLGESFRFQTTEFAVMAFLVSIGAFSIGLTLRFRHWLLTLLPIFLMMATFNYDSIQLWSSDKYRALFVYPSRIDRDSTSTTFHYLFKRDEVITIPSNLHAAHLALDSIFKSQRTNLDSFTAADHHFSTGLWVRNNWGLWSENSNLYKQMVAYGFEDPDDMSHFILQSFSIRSNSLRDSSYDSSSFYRFVVDSLLVSMGRKIGTRAK